MGDEIEVDEDEEELDEYEELDLVIYVYTLL